MSRAGGERPGRDRARERRVRNAWEAGRAAARQLWPGAPEERRRTFADLLALTATNGWYLLVHRRWENGPDAAAGNSDDADAVVVGKAGVFVLGLGSGQGGAGQEKAGEALVGAAKAVESAVQGMDVSAAVVQPLLVLDEERTGARGPAADTAVPVRRAGRTRLVALLHRERQRAGFRPGICRALAEHLEQELPPFRQHALPEDALTPVGPERTTGADEKAVGGDGQYDTGDGTGEGEGVSDALFSEETVREEGRGHALSAPIESWMTYLEQDQLPLVRRDWNGPARISGPAGTGKTVVGLHRAAYLAQRTGGRVLYVTYANNLPRVQRTFLRTMSPYTADRVDFRSLYQYVLELLRERGVPHRLNQDQADNALNMAWSRVRREHPEMNAHDSSGDFWFDEVSHVIKGRGCGTLADYKAVPRRGRGALPRGVRREMVWRLYEEYRELLRERGLHDLHDVLALALAEVEREQPAATPYTSVVVDEAQDLPLLGVRLLHALVGDARNGLLLIGDGQQAVFPGGFRLTDAGVDVRGDRGQVLRSNYRNAPQVARRALAVVQGVRFEDLDGTTGDGARDVELTCRDGTVTEVVCATTHEHDEALLAAVRRVDDPGSAALLCPALSGVGHYRRLLESAGIPVCPLENYEGVPVQAVKIGTYVRAKGLDFKQVFLPRHDERLDGGLDRSRLFVAMTRARDALWLGSVRRTPERD